MEKLMKKLWIPLVLVVVLVAGLFSGYNGLVKEEEAVNGAWSKVETQLQRRSDLIPNLVATVKGYAAQETAIFTALAEARTKLAGASGVSETEAATGELNDAISRLLVIVENYPDLKSNTNFLALQDELAGTENRIATARTDYNDTVQSYNTKIKSLPTVLYAGLLGFSPKEYFQADDNGNPQVDF
jgi:LemA protein